MSLMDSFPGTPRGEQESIINRIDDIWNKKGKKYVICQAPTGSGKSFIGATAGLSSKDAPRSTIGMNFGPRVKCSDWTPFGSYVLTTTKQLQDQYIELFPQMSGLKGKGNYVCAEDPMLNAGCAKCRYLEGVMPKCLAKGHCEYLNSYDYAMHNKFTALNYNMYLTLPPHFREKDILICDEASELEDTLVSQYSVDITYKELDRLGVLYSRLPTDNPEHGFLWVSEIMSNLSDALPSQKEILNSKSTTLRSKVTKMREINDSLKSIHSLWNSLEFIIETKPEGVRIMPLKVNSLAQTMFRDANKVLLMSATIINHKKFAETLGIRATEYEFIDVASDFDPKKSPIYVGSAKFDMRYKSIDRELNGMAKAVRELSEIHSKDKGVIHTHSFKITQAIKRVVGNDPRYLFRDKFASNEDILREHYENPNPTVLVSPSLSFGTSLDDDFGRFQIITKMPYLPLSDKRIKTLLNRDYNWYRLKMWTTMIQMSGRCTRSVDDHSETYIFDKSFIEAIGKDESRLPSWFTDRLV